ncbi:MAG: 4Fe-4S ferredoxin [Rhodospirillales bacterium RIFCSPLOWO2_12_FULL_58_28]|nr:MAG: 4Fe-4S ferredoxin [Rhodospirillales bacterium RIFCSPLOWO2_02_FULL_58_16]OHC78602.1 MAG: 4Fe-4S ferredoxin [Rhodospirillales bacterium RIFCSPLOWO2_12_FULL_58_28]
MKAGAAQDDSKLRMATIYIMGKLYHVPAEATIMGAIEYAGQQIIRGAGCREGYCGACGTIYRLPGDYKIYSGLACTTLVKEGMIVTQIPAFPVQKAIYNLEDLEPTVATIQKIYPVVFRCVSCNTCTKVCPQGLEVMDYVNAAMRGDIESLMDLSFDCVCCGLCAMRCPAEIVQHKVGILGKRLYGRYLRKESPELAVRVKQVKDGVFDKEYEELMAMGHDKLKKAYYDRDME